MRSKKFAVQGGNDTHNENTGQQIPLRTVLGTSVIVMDEAIRVKLNLLFAQFTVLGRGSGRETSEEFFVPAEGDDLFGTGALRGIRCSCCSHKVLLIPAKISVQ